MPKIKNEKKTSVIPLTKDGIFYPDPGIETPLKENITGKNLKNVLDRNDLLSSIPIALMNEKIVNYLEFSPHTVRIPNKGELKVYGGIAGFQNLSRHSTIALSLQDMNFRPLYIQIEVSEDRSSLDPGYEIDLYEGKVLFPVPRNRPGIPVKHTLSKLIPQNDIHSSIRFIVINRYRDNWNLHKIKVYVLETTL